MLLDLQSVDVVELTGVLVWIVLEVVVQLVGRRRRGGIGDGSSICSWPCFSRRQRTDRRHLRRLCGSCGSVLGVRWVVL